MTLTEVIKVWEILHVKSTGDLSFCDLEKALDRIVGVKNDITDQLPVRPNNETTGE